MKISIVICTHNRSDLLSLLFDSLMKQTFDVNEREILLIDNASTDETQNITKQYFKILFGLKYIYEPEIGLSLARNRGWKEAKGEYVIYIDDDAKAVDGWLSSAVQVAEEHSPDIFGGPFFAFYLQSKPKWFKDQYGSYNLGEKGRFLNPGEFLTGGNLAIRRSLLQSTGGFRTDLGMTGKKIAFGEETELQLKIRRENTDVQVYYEPKMSILHLVRPEKMRVRYMIRQYISNGRDTFRVFGKPDYPKLLPIRTKLSLMLSVLWQLTCTVINIVAKFTCGLVFHDKKEFDFTENYIIEICLPLIKKLAYLKELFIQILKVRIVFHGKTT